jgi:DNA-binding MarR family transcriptional regulator
MSRKRAVLLDLYATFHKSGQLVDRACEGTGITPEDFAFVSIVGNRQPVTPTEISRNFGLSLSTVLFRAQRNVDLGFVGRVENPEDRRSFLLSLTPKGTRAWHAAGQRLGRILESLEQRLDRPVEELQEALLALQRGFDAELSASEETARR